MEKITKYRANDGSEWSTKLSAAMREDMIIQVQGAMKNLKDHPTDLNWDGYVQHSEESVVECKKSLFSIANKEGVLAGWIEDQMKSHGKTTDDLIYNSHPSWFGRMLDGAHTPLMRAYGRLCRIDDLCREWNQPYFVSNPPADASCVG